jgi:hypothetical protein
MNLPYLIRHSLFQVIDIKNVIRTTKLLVSLMEKKTWFKKKAQTLHDLTYYSNLNINHFSAVYN